MTYSDCPVTMTAKATAVVDSSAYTAIPVTFSFDSLFQNMQFAYLFPNLTLNTFQASDKITLAIALLSRIGWVGHTIKLRVDPTETHYCMHPFNSDKLNTLALTLLSMKLEWQ